MEPTIIIFIILIVIIIYSFSSSFLFGKIRKDYFTQEKKFVIPNSSTVVKHSEIKKYTTLGDIMSQIKDSKTIYKGNILDFPTFFHVGEKWPGSLPRASYQGLCSSCWAFSSVNALSGRFYIESCGLSGCKNYPQINYGSLNNVYYNLNNLYKFRKLYLTDAFKFIDSDRNNKITIKEWTDVIMKYYETFNSQGSPYIEKHYVAQVLVYILNFQSLGSIDLSNKNAVQERANDAFDIWITILDSQKYQIGSKVSYENENETNSSTEQPTTQPTIQSTTQSTVQPTVQPTVQSTVQPTGKPNDKNYIDINKLKELWDNEPISLSAEKLIGCCNNCISTDYETKDNVGPAVCQASTLDEAWTMLRESGTPTAMCIGYNLDSWNKNVSPTCKEIQGPLYSFCSGYALERNKFNIGDRGSEKSVMWHQDLEEVVKNFESSGINPLSVPNDKKNLPWIDPQLFRFRAKNVYKVQSNVKAIQREILERGPVTAAFEMYPNFQYQFGQTGGQLYTEGDPLGYDKTSLIYMNMDTTEKPIGGHAIVIVGWGTYKYKNYEVPYWICLNSWGIKWGHSGFSPYEDRTKKPENMKSGGYFWIIRGINNCGIEDNVIAGQPDIENISYPGTVERYGWGLPSPSKQDVSFVEQRTGKIEFADNNYLIFNPSVVGGGTYTDRKKIVNKDGTITYEWQLNSMDQPNPFTLFWSEPRPVYCIGPTQNSLLDISMDDTVSLNKDSIDILRKIVAIQKNPYLIIGDEQLQLLNIQNDKQIQVYRAINNSSISRHEVGSILKVVPFNELSPTKLNSIAKVCDNIETVVE